MKKVFYRSIKITFKNIKIENIEDMPFIFASKELINIQRAIFNTKI